MAKREYDDPKEAAVAAEWQAIYEEEKKGGAENPIVEFFTYICFVSFSNGKGRKKRKRPKHVELIGERGSCKRHQMKNGEFPNELQKHVELQLGTDNYDQVVDNLRRRGKR